MNLDEENKRLCSGCTQCCEYISLEIDKPKKKEDFESIIWYVLHKNISVYIDEEGDWYLEILAKCKALNNKGLCKIYKQRPEICRKHTQEDCEKYGEGDYYKYLFKTREDVLKFIKEHTKIKME